MPNGPQNLVLFRHPWAYLVHANGPWYLVLSKMHMLRKCPWVQIAHNGYLYFWFTELRHKSTTTFHWTSVFAVVTANNNSFCLRGLAGNGTWGEVDGSAWTKYLHGHFEQNQISANPLDSVYVWIFVYLLEWHIGYIIIMLYYNNLL